LQADPVGLNRTDSDGDWITDEWEIVIYGTNPGREETRILLNNSVVKSGGSLGRSCNRLAY